MMKNGKSNRGRQPRKQTRALIPHPRALGGTELRHSPTLRFVANAAFVGNITFQNILDTMLVATTATALSDVFQSVKIRHVEVFALPVVGGAASVSVEFSGVTAGAVGDQKIHSDTSMGIQPAHVLARPDRRALAGQYQLSSAANAITLACPAGSVIDIGLELVGQFGSNTAAQNAGVAATAGAFYLRGLDGLAVATSVLRPELQNVGALGFTI